jgi:hypothetical protein
MRIRPALLAGATLVAAATVLAASGCKTETPVSPPLPLPALGISLLPANGSPNVLTLVAGFCGCASGAVDVTVNNGAAGTLGCGETKSVPVAAVPIRLQLSSTEIVPFDGVVPFDRQGAVLGYRVGVVCAH